MTSCDENLLSYIPIQLESITQNLSNYKINFYIFHDGKAKFFVNQIKSIKYKNIKVKDIVVDEVAMYDEIAKYGGNWCGAAYYSLCCQKYLPSKFDRILYIDAGDILIVNDIADYYFADFEDKSIIATSIKFKIEDNDSKLFIRDDMIYLNYLTGIARGLFNSGSYVINLNKFRMMNFSLNDYLNVAKLINSKLNKNFFGDQGFLSLIFVGDIKFFGYPQTKDISYMPHNFGLWYFDKVEDLNYQPAIIHFIGDKIFKPWQSNQLDDLKPQQKMYYELWNEYALKSERRIKN